MYIDTSSTIFFKKEHNKNKKIINSLQKYFINYLIIMVHQYLLMKYLLKQI